MAVGISANRAEILQIANAVAQEKTIDKRIVLEAMEEAIQKAARSRYGLEHDIRAEINPDSGETRLWRVQTVVETVENPITQLNLEDAKKIDNDAEIGNELREELPPFEFGRVAAQTAKQVITGKVRDAERDRQYGDFKDRVGEIINGTVKRVEYGHVIVDLGRAEGVIRRNDGIPRENFNTGDRVRAYLYKVVREAKGPQIFLSRAHPSFMIALFAQEVPEVYEGVIEIKACARDPGSRAKIGVFSHDNSIDPVGACVGMRGARVQAVVSELGGEKIDIIPWSGDDATFIVNALQPAEVSKVVIDEEEGRVEVVVEESQFPLAIGRRGQNVRLARSSPAGRSTSPPRRLTASGGNANSRSAPTCSRRLWTPTRRWPSCSPRKASRRSRRLPMSILKALRRSKASTKRSHPNSRSAPANISRNSQPSSMLAARNWASPTKSPSWKASRRPWR